MKTKVSLLATFVLFASAAHAQVKVDVVTAANESQFISTEFKARTEMVKSVKAKLPKKVVVHSDGANLRLEIVSIERRAVGAVKETDPGLALLRGSTRVTYETKLTAKLMHRCQKCSEFQIADTLIVTTAMYDPAEQLARQLETWVKDNQSLLK